MLDRYRVLELCDERAGRLAGLLLAELGADVAALDRGRRRRDPSDVLLDRGKWSVDPVAGGEPAVASLVDHADVVLCDWPTTRRLELGLDETSLRTRNPGAVLATVTAYGARGPFAGLPYDAEVAAALAGVLGSQWAHRDGGVYALPDFGSHMAGAMTAAGVAGALFGREVEGTTRTMRTSVLAGWLGARNVHAVTGQGVTSVSVRDPQGGLTPVMRLYRAGDGGWLILSCSTDAFWGKLCIAIERADLTGDPRFEQAPFGITPTDKEALVEILTSTFASKPRDEWIAILRSGDVPCAPVYSPEEGLADAQVVANGGVVDVDVDGVGTTRQIAPLLRFDAPGVGFRHGPRPPGADTDDVHARWCASPPPAARGGVANTLPLVGVRVLEICDWVSGPAAGQTLRHLGAEVWKVESRHGDPAQNLDYVYTPMNAGKAVLRIDLRRSEGREVLSRLIGAADVLVHNHRPRRAAELGFDADAAQARNPRLVHHQVYSYGPDGPLAGDPAFDQLVAARTGLAWLQGGMTAGNPPVLHNGSTGDLPAAHLVVLAVVAGLLERQETGRGTRSWSTLLEAGFLLNHSDAASYPGRPARAEGGPDYLGPTPARRLYRTADDWVLVGALDDATWGACARVLDLDLGAYGSAASAPPEGALATRIAARLREDTSAAWEARALAADAPIVAIRYDTTVSEQEHVSVNGYTARGVKANGDEYACPGHLIQVDGQEIEGVVPPPDWGDGARRMLAAVGIDGNDFDGLVSQGVVTGVAW